MKCHICKKKFHDGQLIVPLIPYIKNEKRGDFVGNQPKNFICLNHFIKD